MFQFVEQKDVLFCSVGEKQCQVGRGFKLVFGDVLEDLVQGSDPGTTCNHEKVLVLPLPSFFASLTINLTQEWKFLFDLAFGS